MLSRADRTVFRGEPAVALRAADGATAVVLLHGAQVVSWIPAGGQEQLYLSPTSRFGEGTAVRGGVPVIFPQFAGRGPLPRHGFARTRAWTLGEAAARPTHAQAVLQLHADDATRAVWPHEFQAEITVAVSGRQLDIELAVENTGGQSFEFAAALHTYLASADARKLQIEGLQGVHFEDNGRAGQPDAQTIAQWGDVLTVVGEVDRLYRDVPRPLTLREHGRRLSLQHSGFEDAVVWNPGPEKCARLDDMPADDWLRMICIEAAQVGQPVLLAPGDEWAGMQTLVA